MNIFLMLFAIPVSLVILSMIFETIIKSPIKIAGIVFSIFFIITFYFGGTAELLVATILYTFLSYITAVIVCIIYGKKYCIRNRNFNPIEKNNEFTNFDNEFDLDNSYKFNNYKRLN